MRQILHPGAPPLERTASVLDTPVPLRFTLRSGCSVDEAIAQGFAEAGCAGGFVAFDGGLCEPFRYVMPAASPDADHVAWYSETYEPAGGVEIKRACAIVGIRDGKSFIHCHGIWSTADGERMGHLLAPITTVSKPFEVHGIGFRDATFEAIPDPETNFTLFEPVRTDHPAPATGRGRALLAKVRPNEDITVAIEQICSNHGISKARIHGIGSLNEVRFTDGTLVASHATEVSIREGWAEHREGEMRAELSIDVVDMKGGIFSGTLVRGDNPVCVTFELVIVDAEDQLGPSR
jgi:predicted DNA-binding protein with PD1-like motif